MPLEQLYAQCRDAVGEGRVIDFSTEEWQGLVAGVDGFRVEAGHVVATAAAFTALIKHLFGAVQSDGGQIQMRFMVVDGPVNLIGRSTSAILALQNCRFRGILEICGLHCAGLSLAGTHLDQGMDARGASIAGYLMLRRGFRSDGPVLLRDVVVGGILDLTDSQFLFDPERSELPRGYGLTNDHEGEALGASRLRAHTIVHRDVVFGEGAFSLRDAYVEIFRHDMKARALKSWPAPGGLRMNGFRYVRKDDADHRTFTEWLLLDPANLEENARVLIAQMEETGAPDRAHRLALWYRRRANSGKPLPLRIAQDSYLALLELSFRPALTAGLFLALFLAVVGFVEWCWWQDYLRPGDIGLISNKCYMAATCTDGRWLTYHTSHGILRLPAGVPIFDPWSYALYLLFPYFPAGSISIWGGTNALVDLALLMFRGSSLALQAALLWHIIGNRFIK